MTKHPLNSEESFEKFLNKLSCNGCVFFVDKKCTHKTSIENEKAKSELVKHSMEKGTSFSIEWAKNIDNNFVCDFYTDN